MHATIACRPPPEHAFILSVGGLGGTVWGDCLGESGSGYLTQGSGGSGNGMEDGRTPSGEAAAGDLMTYLGLVGG